jgi:hypothetical protein
VLVVGAGLKQREARTVTKTLSTRGNHCSQTNKCCCMHEAVMFEEELGGTVRVGVGQRRGRSMAASTGPDDEMFTLGPSMKTARYF